ncbi:MAG: RNA polymerase sporulation sigma factor SigK [Lachnospiraceae bacterium]|nr:RNA polymerase sporulation sigma factor SigK [Lachnospiraceae bacterium]
MKSFPKPLNANEEREYLIKCRAGDIEARNILIERNLRLVAYIVKKYNSSECNQEDMISIGTIGLIKAVDSFNIDKGIRLATYASRCIDNELLMLFRSEKKQSREVYLNEPIGSDKEGNEISLLDVIEAVDDDIIEQINHDENISKLYVYIGKLLTDREKEIIYLRYGIPDGGKEFTQREIADMMGISRSYVSRIEKRALLKLKNAYDEENRI